MNGRDNDSVHFFTQQLFLIGTYNEDGNPNFAPISWVSYTWGPPDCLIISINGRTRIKQTTMNIDRTKRISATIVTPDLLPFAEQNNRATHREGIIIPHEIERGRVLEVPLLKEAKWSYECEIIQTVHIGGCDTHFAAIRHINVHDDLKHLEFVDLREINPVVYSPNHYFTIGEHIGEIGDYAK